MCFRFRLARTCPTLISLNRFEKKKNAALAIEAFAMVLEQLTQEDKMKGYGGLRLVLAGILLLSPVPWPRH